MLQNHQLFFDYCEKFYGYGSWNSKIWFIGMEEGGKGSATESAIKKRLELWDSRGRRDSETSHEFYNELGYANQWFASKPKLQSTWKQLIRVLLHINKLPITNDFIRTYQSQKWGRHECEAAIFEMFPLPAGHSQAWPYAEFTDAPFLKSRDIYANHFFHVRAKYLREKISSHEPECIVFYGMTYGKRFEKVIQAKFMPTNEEGLFRTVVGKTDCFLISHPTRKGVTNAYFENVGKFISDTRGKILFP